MARLVIVLAFIGIAYWYWTGPYKNSVNTPPVDDPKQNAKIMAQCVARENFADADNDSISGEDPEQACADAYGLYKIYGKWYHR